MSVTTVLTSWGVGLPAAAREGEDADRLLICAARSGDASAFERIFERHAAAVRRFARDLLRDDAEADEATQETFVRAHDRLGRLREEDRLRSWLLGIAKHVCFEHVRGARRERLRLRVVADAAEAPHTPEHRLLDRERAARMEEALAALSPERRTALLLRFDHALPYVEIAQVMGWSLAKAKVEVHRARVVLRERVDGADEEAP